MPSEVLQTVPVDQPDLFATAPDSPSFKSQPAERNPQLRSNGRVAGPREGADHG